MRAREFLVLPLTTVPMQPVPGREPSESEAGAQLRAMAASAGESWLARSVGRGARDRRYRGE
jgi:hypothetical protein